MPQTHHAGPELALGLGSVLTLLITVSMSSVWSLHHVDSGPMLGLLKIMAFNSRQLRYTATDGRRFIFWRPFDDPKLSTFAATL